MIHYYFIVDFNCVKIPRMRWDSGWTTGADAKPYHSLFSRYVNYQIILFNVELFYFHDSMALTLCFTFVSASSLTSSSKSQLTSSVGKGLTWDCDYELGKVYRYHYTSELINTVPDKEAAPSTNHGSACIIDTLQY